MKDSHHYSVVMLSLTAEETEVTTSVMSSGFLTPVVSRLATGALCIIIFFLMMWRLPAVQ